MRLIDADKLRFRHTVKCNSNTTRPYTLNCISFDEVQNAPTIKAVPIDVLDRIRAEIEQDAFKDVNGTKYIFVNRVNQIIDKHRNEVNE